MIDQAHALVYSPGWRYLWPPAAGAGLFLAALALRGLLLSRLKRLAARTKWAWDDLLVEAVRGPSVLWCLIAAVYFTVVAWPVSPGAEQLARQLLGILWLVSLMLAGLRSSDQLIQQYGRKLSAALPLTSLTQNLTKALILVTGSLMILNGLGISIAPILTALGVGGLAVALALQETLSNLFAGIYVTAARQVRVGDYIKMDSGQQGHVADIGWRSTRIQTLDNSLVVVPNTKLSQAIVTNFDLPTQELAVLVEMSVDYRGDLEKMERAASEVGKEVMKQVPGGMPDFEPFIRYHTFGESGVQFTVVLRGRGFVDQYLLKHEFIKRIHRRCAQEGIVLPSLARALLVGEAAWNK